MEKNKKVCEQQESENEENEENVLKNEEKKEEEEEEKEEESYDYDYEDYVYDDEKKNKSSTSTSTSSSEYDTDSSECDSNDEKEILKSLLLLNEFKKKKKESKKKEFLPSLKTFFKANMKQKHKLYDENIKKKIYFLAKNILSKKIPVDYSPEYRYLLNRIVKRKMHSNDVKIALCEDYCLTGIFSKAVKLIEISQKNDKCK